MTAILEALRDKPLALYQMDDTAPFQDYSGYNRTGTTVSGTVTRRVGLVNGAFSSSAFSNAVVGKFDSPVFTQGKEKAPFSLEVWAYSLATLEQQVLGNLNQMDGLTINGTVVSFVTKYSTTGECRASYDLQIRRRFHAVGVHTSEKNMLFIDGELVAETEITEAQKADTFVSTDGFLYSGTTADAGTVLLRLNNVGIYATALPPAAIARHYAVGNNHVPAQAVAQAFGGLRIPLTNTLSDIFLSEDWTTEDDWLSGELTDINVDGDSLKPRSVANVSVAGTWYGSFPLEEADAATISGMNMTWDGQGAVVEVSLDGTTWETVQRAKALTTVPAGTNPANKVLEIRISFPGGINNDSSYIRNLVVNGYYSGVLNLGDYRTITVDGNIRSDYEPVEFRSDWGARVANTKTVVIGADTSTDPMLPRTISIWARGSYTINITPTATYSNAGTGIYSGGATSYSLWQSGDWQMRTFTLAAGHTGDIIITSTDDETVIGQVTLFPDEKSAAEVGDIYSSHIGIMGRSVSDTGVVAVTEPAEASKIYARDWSISSAG